MQRINNPDDADAAIDSHYYRLDTLHEFKAFLRKARFKGVKITDKGLQKMKYIEEGAANARKTQPK